MKFFFLVFLGLLLAAAPFALAPHSCVPSHTHALYAGFGSSSTPKAPTPLKPKVSWDNFSRLRKGGDTVEERSIGISFEGQWFPVGRLRWDSSVISDGENYGVVRCKRLIAEHAHRINPVEIPKSISDLVIGVSSSKDVSSVADSEWVLSSPPSEYKKSFASLISKDKDRAIGFEGIPHESTGYYCEYENGVITSRSGSKAVSAPPSP